MIEIMVITLFLVSIIFIINIVFVSLWIWNKIRSKKNNYRKLGQSTQKQIIEQISEAVIYLSKNKIGTLITIENHDNLDYLRTDGLEIEANISAALLIAIFNKKSPLHDGAVIIREDRIVYAATYFKITSKALKNNYGARHRAALGISEQSDSLSVVVSEETGVIAFAKSSKMEKVSQTQFKDKLLNALKDKNN